MNLGKFYKKVKEYPKSLISRGMILEDLAYLKDDWNIYIRTWIISSSEKSITRSYLLEKIENCYLSEEKLLKSMDNNHKSIYQALKNIFAMESYTLIEKPN